MHQDEKVLSLLINHFKSTSWPLDVDDSKLRKRYTIASDQSRPNWHIIEIERHRSTLGATYKRGRPMSAFETYYMRFAVNFDAASVEELPERLDEQGASVDVVALIEEHLSIERFYLSVIAVDATHYEIREGCSKESKRITDERQAIDFSLDLANQIEDYFQEYLVLDLDVNEEKQENLLAQYRETLLDALTEKAKDAWRERERWDEDV